MISNTDPPNNDIRKVEAGILEVVAKLRPQNLTTRELSLRIISDPDDPREIEAMAQAITGLREFGLLCEPDDEIVKPTPAALRAVALLISS